MHVYKFNVYANRYYVYDTERHGYDLESEMFDSNLHKNDVTPEMHNRLQCGYCGTVFTTRSKLFYHLEFNNIDTKLSRHVHDEDPQLGEEGFAFTKRIYRKINRYNTKVSRSERHSTNIHINRKRKRNKDEHVSEFLTSMVQKYLKLM